MLAILLWGCAVIGYVWSPLSLVERIFAAVSACLLVAAIPMTDELGFAGGAAFIGWLLFRRRQCRSA